MKKIKGYNIVKAKTNELLVSIEIGNDEVIEKDGYKVIPLFEEIIENPTIEQNAGENRIEGGVVGISGSVKEKHFTPFSFNCGLIDYCGTKNIWVKSKFDSNCVLQITGYTVDDEGRHCVWLTDSWITLEKLFDDFVFLDDSPIGVEV